VTGLVGVKRPEGGEVRSDGTIDSQEKGKGLDLAHGKQGGTEASPALSPAEVSCALRGAEIVVGAGRIKGENWVTGAAIKRQKEGKK